MCLGGLLLATGNAIGQDGTPFQDSEAPVNWALAPVLGTGWYTLGDGRDAFIVYMPYTQTLREVDAGGTGLDAAGWYINWAGSLGLFELDLDPGIIDPDNFGTFSFTPGIEAEIPLGERWSLRPYLNFGRGVSIGDGPEAWIYYGGLKSRTWLDAAQRLSLLVGAGYAGFDPQGGTSGGLWTLYSGGEYRLPVQLTAGPPLDLFMQAGYRAVDDTADFGLRSAGDGNPLKAIGDTVELGLALGPAAGEFRWGFLAVERIGLTWNFEPDGDFSSITLDFRSWFRQ